MTSTSSGRAAPLTSGRPSLFQGREIRKCSSGKRRFLDKASCEARIKLNRKTGLLSPYLCPECGQWHLTSVKQG